MITPVTTPRLAERDASSPPEEAIQGGHASEVGRGPAGQHGAEFQQPEQQGRQLPGAHLGDEGEEQQLPRGGELAPLPRALRRQVPRRGIGRCVCPAEPHRDGLPAVQVGRGLPLPSPGLAPLALALTLALALALALAVAYPYPYPDPTPTPTPTPTPNPTLNP